MASGYGQYDGYYDANRSQATQQQAYNYPSAASQPATAAYSASSYPTYSSGNTYDSQTHGSSTGGQHTGSRDYYAGGASAATGTGTAAGGPNGQDPHASSRSNSIPQHDSGSGAWGSLSYPSSAYGSSLLQQPARTQSNASPLYASRAPSATAPSSYDRSNYAAPTQQAQSNASSSYDQQSYGHQSGTQSYAASGSMSAENSRQTYHGLTPSSEATNEPSRYASPLHAVQAQQQQPKQQSQHQLRHQGLGRQASRTPNHQPSNLINSRPQQADRCQASASVEPTSTTVDSSQVYDFRAEREKKAKAEEASVSEEQRPAKEANRKAEEARVNEERLRVQQAAAKAEAERKREEERKTRESTNAAGTLASTTSSSNIPDQNNLPPANDEEAEMRAMFQKMREFNAKNPAMLAKLWEEERHLHAAQSQSPQPSTQSASPPPKKPSAPKRALSSTALSGNTTTPAQMKPAAPTAPVQAPVSPEATRSATQNQAAAPNALNAPQANAHLWPPGKKGLLAEIAARWLQSMNTQRDVTTSEILKLLDTNPNYVQLCESLEGLGLAFERAAFARELLRGIPPTSPVTANQPSPQVSDATIMSTNGTVAQASGMTAPNANSTVPAPKRKRATKAEMERRRAAGLVDTLDKQGRGKGKDSNSGMVDYEMPSFSVSEDAPPGAYVTHLPERATPIQVSHVSQHCAETRNRSRQPSHPVQPQKPDERSTSVVHQGPPMPIVSALQTPEVKPPSPVRPPANKEEAARKRGFGDLVDLTAGDSDDDDTPPMKLMKTSQFQRPSENSAQQGQQQQQHHQPGPHQQFQQRQMQQPGSFPSRYTGGPSPGSMAGPFNAAGSPASPRLYTQPNGSVGLTKPTPTPTNAAQLHVPSSAPPPPKRKGPTNEQLQIERMRGRLVVEPIMRDRVARRSTYDSRTIARDILLATGRHPDMRPLNGHVNVMQKLLGDKGGMLDQSGNKSDLATIKWDILDPAPPKNLKTPAPAPAKENSLAQGQTQALAMAKERNESNFVRSTGVDAGDADDEEDVQSSSAYAASGLNLMEGSAERTRDSSANVSSKANENNKPPPKKRGRPPRQSVPNGSAFAGANSPMVSVSKLSGTPSQASSQAQSTPATAPASRATSSAVPSGTPTGYAAFRQLDANGNPIKKKGRPVGWRKDLHSREAQGLEPKRSGTYTQKPKNAPAQLQEPKYQAYKCRWSDCKAELHSFEVLKKHVIKIHGKPDAEEEFHCQWRGCDEQSTSFDGVPAWLAHVDKEHLQPVAWKLGDGPWGGLSDQQDSELSEAYLSDSRGRSVTPIIRPMSTMSMDNTIASAGAGRPPAGLSKDERVAHQDLQRLKERKKAVGISLEKTGVRLANEKRRMGFLDDENFEEIIESDG